MVEDPVIDAEGAIGVAGLQQVQGEVPGVVHIEKVARGPVLLALLHESHTVGDEALHFVGVDHGMDAPHVIGMGFDRSPARLFGQARFRFKCSKMLSGSRP